MSGVRCHGSTNGNDEKTIEQMMRRTHVINDYVMNNEYGLHILDVFHSLLLMVSKKWKITTDSSTTAARKSSTLDPIQIQFMIKINGVFRPSSIDWFNFVLNLSIIISMQLAAVVMAIDGFIYCSKVSADFFPSAIAKENELFRPRCDHLLVYIEHTTYRELCAIGIFNGR